MDRERSTMENYIFEKMPVLKAYMKLAIPVVMSMIVSLVYNMVDTYFIALTGVQELVAGVSLAAPVFTMMIAFGDIFGLGGSSLISRLFGEKREEEAKYDIIQHVTASYTRYGREVNYYGLYFLSHCRYRGWCSLPLHHQMVGW